MKKNRMAAALADIAGLVENVVTVEPEIDGVVTDRNAPGTVQLDTNTPTMGDTEFYRYMIPGAVFVDKAGSYWILEHITDNGLFRIRNMWYPRMELTIPQNVIRETIHAITDPVWVVIPPLPVPGK